MLTKLIDDSVVQDIKRKYKSSSSRIFFLDYDGTLIPFTRFPQEAKINETALSIIDLLTRDDRNEVVIISGRDRNFLEQQFDGQNLTLIAEHGYLIRYPSGEWKRTSLIKLEWKNAIENIFAHYVNKCPGSIIEKKEGSIAWHYRNADPVCASNLVAKLKDDIKNYFLDINENITILDGNKVLEVKSANFNKGSIALSLLNKNRYDFILGIGDDRTDEDLFRALPPSAITIKVALVPTFAKYFLEDQSMVYKLLCGILK